MRTDSMETAARTIKLYDDRPYDLSFTGEIIYAGPMEEGTRKLILDRTLFFPEEGGQSCDRGMLGGEMVDHVLEEAGVITHWIDKPLAPGTEVTGEIDWEKRFSDMQQHTGEHIVSGLVNSLY